MDLGIGGRRAAVAAASRGLGFATAAALAADGVQVAICGREAGTIEEAAHVLSVSPSTAKRDWRTAKAWLTRELGSEVRP